LSKSKIADPSPIESPDSAGDLLFITGAEKALNAAGSAGCMVLWSWRSGRHRRHPAGCDSRPRLLPAQEANENFPCSKKKREDGCTPVLPGIQALFVRQ